MMNLTCREITDDIVYIQTLFDMASEDEHKNANNYSKPDRVWDYVAFHVVETPEGEPVAFSGMYPFDNDLVRVLDRTYYFPKFRAKGVSQHPLATRYMLRPQSEIAKELGLIPFFSVQGRNRRGGLERVLYSWNHACNGDTEYVLLDGFYNVCKGRHDTDACWHTVAVQKNYEKNVSSCFPMK